MPPKPSELLPHVPDLPRWVEARGLLLHDDCVVYGANSADCVVCDWADSLLCVVGEPALNIVRTAIADSPEPATILVIPESRGYVQSLLPDWQCRRAIIHQMKQPPVAGKESTYTDAEVRFCLESEVRSLPASADELKEELLRSDALETGEIAATFVDGKPVSFCYSGYETERFWDVAIDTLPGFRRRGYAEQCFRFLLKCKLQQNKQPVWGAEVDNIPSRQLALKLGFIPVDELFLFCAERD